MRKISKAQMGIDTTKRIPIKKDTTTIKKPLSAKEREALMIKELNKKGSMPASKTNIGRKGIKIKAKGGKQMLKRADGSVSQRGLWDNLRKKAAQNKRTGAKPKAPTKAMLAQEKKIKAKGK